MVFNRSFVILGLLSGAVATTPALTANPTPAPYVIFEDTGVPTPSPTSEFFFYESAGTSTGSPTGSSTTSPEGKDDSPVNIDSDDEPGREVVSGVLGKSVSGGLMLIGLLGVGVNVFI